ncbi:MAG: hypothetical protein AB7M05_05150 [Alphaproteobacteria bacterium]
MAGTLPVWTVIKETYAAVFRDFSGFAARVWAWTVLIWLTTFVVVYLSLQLPRIFTELNLVFLILLPMYAGVAVALQRRVLLGENRRGLRALRFGWRELKASAIGTMLAIGFWGPFVLGGGIIDTGAGTKRAVLFVLLYAIAISGAFLYMALRLSLAFPLTATDERRVFDQSWVMLRGKMLRLFAILLVTYYPMAVVTGKLTQLLILAATKKAYVSVFLVHGLMIIALTLSICLAAGAASLVLTHLRGTAPAHA